MPNLVSADPSKKLPESFSILALPFWRDREVYDTFCCHLSADSATLPVLILAGVPPRQVVEGDEVGLELQHRAEAAPRPTWEWCASADGTGAPRSRSPEALSRGTGGRTRDQEGA